MLNVGASDLAKESTLINLLMSWQIRPLPAYLEKAYDFNGEYSASLSLVKESEIQPRPQGRGLMTPKFDTSNIHWYSTTSTTESLQWQPLGAVPGSTLYCAPLTR